MTINHKQYVTITSGLSGFFAVHVWWNTELGGFWEPYDTGLGRYQDFKDAEAEAIDWAKDLGLEYRAPDISSL